MPIDLLDFSKGSYLPEDRWLRFALRLSFVLFVLGIELIVIVALIQIFIKL